LTKKLFTYFITLLTIPFAYGQEVIRYDTDSEDEFQIDTTFRPPSFPGGENEFLRDIEYYLGRPEWYGFLNQFGDKVYLEFIVKADGSVDKIKINNTSNFDLNVPLKRALASQTWNPRVRNGKAVSTKISYALNIRSIPEFPYAEVKLEPEYIYNDPATKHFKIFAVVGLLLIMGTLFLVN
jgi:hypothetical protein